MATSQKKPSTGGKRSSTSKSGASKRTAAPPPAQKPIRREVGAVCCLLVGLLAGFGYFKLEGVAINLVCNLFSGLVGFGFYFVPPACFVAAGVLFMHRGRPVKLRVISCLLIPVLIASLIELPFSQAGVLTELWKSGLTHTSGGVISGGLTSILVTLVSRVGTGIVLVIFLLLSLLTAWNITPGELIDYLRSRPKPLYEPEPEVPAAPKPAAVSAQKKQALDLPLSSETPPTKPQTVDKPAASPTVDEPLPGKPERRSFFFRKPEVQAPDQVLAAIGEIVAEVADAPEAAPELPPLQSEPIVEKVKPSEAANAAREVAAEIETQQGQERPPYHYPPLSLLAKAGKPAGQDARAELKENAERLSATIHSFGIDANITGITRGPSVTRYELELDQGVRLNKLTNLADDIALSLGASGVRIAPIPGKISMVGVEVPNKLVSPVPLGEVISSEEFQGHKSRVSFSVGKDIGDHFIVSDIAKLPHLLIAGTTGSGKSVCTNSIIISLLYKASPDECRFIMIDPKMVELGVYNAIPHLLIPVVTDPKKAAGALQWAVTEMMKRYRIFSEMGVKDLASYNEYALKKGMEKMPQIVVIIDELADLMLVAAKEVEESICRVAQMGRASGMHLVIATQRPSADVITGLMKANIPSRIAFAVASSMESRIILDHMGAEKLVGRGDMLYLPVGAGKPQRVQGCFIADEEIAAVVEYVKRTGESNYSDEVMAEIELNAAQGIKGGGAGNGSAVSDGNFDEDDELLPAAIEVVLDSGQASVSMLQRRLKLGHSRAGRLMDSMEEKGVVGPHEGSKPREILITKEQWQERQMRTGEYGAVPPAAEPVEEEGDGLDELNDDMPPFDLEKD